MGLGPHEGGRRGEMSWSFRERSKRRGCLGGRVRDRRVDGGIEYSDVPGFLLGCDLKTAENLALYESRRDTTPML